jgi:hypothetical protein
MPEDRLKPKCVSRFLADDKIGRDRKYEFRPEAFLRPEFLPGMFLCNVTWDDLNVFDTYFS